MRRSTRFAISFLVSSFLLFPILEQFSYHADGEKTHFMDLDRTYLTGSDQPICILNDTDLRAQASLNGWNGNGTKKDPFIIENISIDAPGSYCFKIINVSEHIVINNCSLYNATTTGFPYTEGISIMILNSDNITIKYCLLKNNEKGVKVENCGSNIRLIGLNISVSRGDIIEIWDTDHVTVANITFSNLTNPGSVKTIFVRYLSKSSSVIVENCVFNNMALYIDSGFFTINNCTFLDNSFINAHNEGKPGEAVIKNSYFDRSPITVSMNSSIENNTILSKDIGITTTFSGSINDFFLINIIGNAITSDDTGIFVNLGPTVMINNTIRAKRAGIDLNPGTFSLDLPSPIILNNTLIKSGIEITKIRSGDMTVENNTLDGRPILYRNQSGLTSVDIPQNTKQIILAYSDDHHISDIPGLFSVIAWTCENVEIMNCSFSGGYRSINIHNVNNYWIENNTIENSTIGINIYAHGSRIKSIKNNIIRSEMIGIQTYEYYRWLPLEIIGNRMVNCCLFIIGTLDGHSILNNLVNGKFLVYFYGVDHAQRYIPDEIGQLIAVNSGRFNITDQVFSNIYEPICLENCHTVNIDNCTFSNNTNDCISFEYLSSASISNCTFIDNWRGIYSRPPINIYKNSGIRITDCNFINNSGNGIYIKTSNIRIDNCVFTGNLKGLYIEITYPTSYSEVCWNQFVSNRDIGAFIEESGDHPIHNNTFISNKMISNGNNYETGQIYLMSTTDGRNCTNNYYSDCKGYDHDLDGILDEHVQIITSDAIDRASLAYSPHFKIANASCRPVRSDLILNWSYSTDPHVTIVDVGIMSKLEGYDFENVGIVSDKEGFTHEDTYHGSRYYYVLIPRGRSIYSEMLVPGAYSQMICAICDGQAPQIQILSPSPNEVIGHGYVNIQWSASDEHHDVISSIVHLDGEKVFQENGTGQGSIYLERISRGPHEINISVCDEALNWETSTVWFIVDMDDPIIIILEPERNEWTNYRKVSISWKIEDEYSPIDSTTISITQYGKFDVEEFDVEDSGRLVIDFDEGLYYLNIDTRDIWGNRGSLGCQFGVDYSDPLVRLPSKDIFINTTEYLLEWNMTDNVSGISEVDIEIDGKRISFGPIHSYLLTNLSEGDHTINLRVEDRAGNIAKSEEMILHVDLTTPDLTIDEPLPGSILSSSDVALRWSSVDGGMIPLVHYIQVDEGEMIYVGGNKYFMMEGLKNGIHNVIVTCRDTAGNSIMKGAWFTVDLIDPYISRINPNSSPIPVDVKLVVVFSERMDESSVSIVFNGMTGITYYRNNTGYYTPDEHLKYGTDYIIWINGKDLAGNPLISDFYEFTTEDKAWITGKLKLWNEVDPAHLELTIDGIYVPFDNDMGDFNFTTTSGFHKLKLYHKEKLVAEKWMDLEPGETADLGEISYVPVDNNEGKRIPHGFYIFIILALLIFGILGLMIYVKWFIHKDAIINEE